MELKLSTSGPCLPPNKRVRLGPQAAPRPECLVSTLQRGAWAVKAGVAWDWREKRTEVSGTTVLRPVVRSPLPVSASGGEAGVGLRGEMVIGSLTPFPFAHSSCSPEGEGRGVPGGTRAAALGEAGSVRQACGLGEVPGQAGKEGAPHRARKFPVVCSTV